MRSLIIRSATVEDIPTIERMCQRFLSETPYGSILGRCETPVLNGLILQTIQKGIVLLAELNTTENGETKQLVGFMAIFALVHPFTQEPYGDELAWWVEPEHRHGRVGYYLLRSAEEWARQVGLKMLKLVAPAHNGTVFDFLFAHGFTPVETVLHKRLEDDGGIHDGSAGRRRTRRRHDRGGQDRREEDEENARAEHPERREHARRYDDAEHPGPAPSGEPSDE